MSVSGFQRKLDDLPDTYSVTPGALGHSKEMRGKEEKGKRNKRDW